MPAPSSVTVTATPPSTDRDTPVTTVVPARVCLRALESRLTRTWCSCDASPRTIVPTGGEAQDPVLHAILGNQKERRHFGCERADPAQQFDSVNTWKHHVQHQDVRTEFIRELDRRRAIRCHCHGPACHSQPHAHELREAGLVVDDDEGTYWGAVRVAQLGRLLVMECDVVMGQLSELLINWPFGVPVNRL